MSALFSWFIIAILVMGWIVLALLLVTCFIFDYTNNSKFFDAVKETIYANPFNLNKCTESIKNSYDVYKRHNYLIVSEPIIEKCQEILMDIRIGKNLDCFQLNVKNELANRLECVINKLKEEAQFDDEKVYEIITELSGQIPMEVLEEIKRKLTFLQAFHKGVISVKNTEIDDMKNKMKTKRWVSWITGTLGVIGSVASIISLFLSR